MITVLKSKLHRATVTSSLLDYEGSCAIDSSWLRTIGIFEYEQIQIYNVTNGERFTTYAIDAPAGSGEISVRGAASWKAQVGDVVIIAAYELIEPPKTWTEFGGRHSFDSLLTLPKPRVIHFGPNNVQKSEV